MINNKMKNLTIEKVVEILKQVDFICTLWYSTKVER